MVSFHSDWPWHPFWLDMAPMQLIVTFFLAVWASVRLTVTHWKYIKCNTSSQETNLFRRHIGITGWYPAKGMLVSLPWAVHPRISHYCMRIRSSPRYIGDITAESLQINVSVPSPAWAGKLKKTDVCLSRWGRKTELAGPYQWPLYLSLLPRPHVLQDLNTFYYQPQTHSGPKQALTKPGSKLGAPYWSKGMFRFCLEFILQTDGSWEWWG